MADEPIKKRIRRTFTWNGMQLADPNPEWDPRKVKEYYTAEYPALVNATVMMSEGSIQEDDRVRREGWQFQEDAKPKPSHGGTGGGGQNIEFKSKVGTKS